MDKAIDELISDFMERYEDLRALNPNHELLRYFTLEKNILRISEEANLVAKFIDKFHGDFILNNHNDYLEFELPFAEAVFGNYFKALDNAVSYFIET